MASRALNSPAAPVAVPAFSLPVTLARLPLLAVMAMGWLVMLIVAPILLAATLAHDGLTIVRGGRRDGARRATFLPRIF